MPPFLRVQPDGICLSIKLQPRAAQDRIGDIVGSELKVFVTAPPVDSAANEALIRLLAEVLGCSRSAVQLIRGRTSRHKVVRVQNLNAEQIEQRLIEGKQQS